MAEMKAVLYKAAGAPIKVAGDAEVAEALSEGVYAAEVVRLQEEIEILKRELKRAQERAELLQWSMSRGTETRLAELRERAQRKAPLWVRAFLGARLVIGAFIK